MPTYSDICEDYTADMAAYPMSIQSQLRILSSYIYFIGGVNSGDPYDLDSKAQFKGVVATQELIESDYDPREDGAEFFTEFAEGMPILKNLDSKILYSSTVNGQEAGTPSVRKGPAHTHILVSGDFINFNIPSYNEEQVRQFLVTVPVCFKMVLIGNLDSLFVTPLAPYNFLYSPPPLVENPGIPGEYDGPDEYGWFPVDAPPENERIPYWLKPGEGNDQTLPCISPRRFRIRQWGFGVDINTTNANNRSTA